jgi:large subunit ribosomal protein L2
MLQKIKPTTPSQRHLIRINNEDLRKTPLLKSEIKGLKNSSGRNNTGRITSFHKGGGHKQNYRKIDFTRKDNISGIVTSIEYDPNRTANIASVYDTPTKKYFYIISPKNLEVGNIIKSGLNAEISLGHIMSLSKIPEGTFVYNISYKKNGLSKIGRSAGAFVNLLEKSPVYCRITMPSGEVRKISSDCYASIGIVSNELHSAISINKAGRSRWLNKRPTVRGVAMNPIDHPHGGGEGRKSGKDVTPWGKPNKRGKTSTSKNKLSLNKK